jgi:hypothetical protein
VTQRIEEASGAAELLAASGDLNSARALL